MAEELLQAALCETFSSPFPVSCGCVVLRMAAAGSWRGGCCSLGLQSFHLH